MSVSFAVNFLLGINWFLFQHLGLYLKLAGTPNVWQAVGCHPKHARDLDGAWAADTANQLLAFLQWTG